MGFFKKKKNDLELELPPPPPPKPESSQTEDFENKLPELPSLPDIKKEPSDLPPITDLEESSNELPEIKEELPKFPKPQSELPDLANTEEMPIPTPNMGSKDGINLEIIRELEKDIPKVPDLKVLEEELPTLKESDERGLPPLEMPESENKSAGPIMPQDVIREAKPRQGPLFVNISSYKDALSCVTMIKSKVKESEDGLEKLNQIKDLKDKYIEQFRAKLEDLQRKSLYVDKNLFEKGGI